MRLDYLRTSPRLEIVEHYVSHAEMRNRCARHIGFGMTSEAGAEFQLPPQKFMVEHEPLHCAGYDLIGSSNMKRFLEQQVARQGASAAARASR